MGSLTHLVEGVDEAEREERVVTPDGGAGLGLVRGRFRVRVRVRAACRKKCAASSYSPCW